MQKVERSRYLVEKRPAARALLDRLCEEYAYASVLVTDSIGKNYSVSKSGISISENSTFGGKGMVVRVYDGRGYAEYSTNEITMESVPAVLDRIREQLLPVAEKLPENLREAEYRIRQDEPLTLDQSTEYEIHPQKMGDEKIVSELKTLRQKALALDGRLLDADVRLSWQQYHKLFLSPNRDLEENVLIAESKMTVAAVKDEKVESCLRGYSNLGGAEVLRDMEAEIPDIVRNVTDLLKAEPMIPGTYECVCTPEVTGMIAHEAFGHGVEMDMFVKDRAYAQHCIGKRVASDLVTMHDGCAKNEVATYFFDDEGTLSHDTVIIRNGILQTGISDVQSAMYLGTEPTGNGRRQNYERKAYARMTNTYFEPGKDSLEDMISSVKYGMLLVEPTSGMEDPKNWGIQCLVNIAREIKDGKLTGRIFSPVVLTGYVPDLLKSIFMVSDRMELYGSGACGKGYKEAVRVSEGGPCIKAQIRLG